MAVEIAAERPIADAEQLILELEAHRCVTRPRVGTATAFGGWSKRASTSSCFDRMTGQPPAVASSSPPTDDDVGYGEVKRMYVRPAFRGAGFGRAILERPGSGRASEASRCSVWRPVSTRSRQSRCTSKPGSGRSGLFGPYVDDPLSRFFERRLA